MNDDDNYLDAKEFDEAFPDGVFAVPHPKNQPRVMVRALVNYLKEKSQKEGRELQPSDLSEAEMGRFLDWTGVIRNGKRKENR